MFTNISMLHQKGFAKFNVCINKFVNVLGQTFGFGYISELENCALCISNGLDISITYKTEIGVEATKAQGINFDGSSSFAHAL